VPRPSILDEPFVAFGSEIMGELDAALRREWLVTNGLGGYASGTVAGIPTRRYHGLLVAATEPPAGRRVLVAGLVEWAVVGGQRFAMHTLEYADGTIDQFGHRLVAGFELDGTLPVWRFALAGTLLERRVWMAPGANASYVRYAVLRGGPVDLELTPLVTDRPFHELALADGFSPGVTSRSADHAVVVMRPGGVPIGLTVARGSFQATGDWYRGLRHRDELARGLDGLSDAWAPGTFHGRVEVGQPATLGMSTDIGGSPTADPDLDAVRRRQADLLRTATAESAPRPVQQLVLAADQFLVARAAGGRTVIAGYHWFADWGRDTMIALPGLTQVTGRTADGHEILRTFAGLLRDGLLPNALPEADGAATGYNTVDASLWFVHALRACGDAALTLELLPAVASIVEGYVAGTSFGIGVDPADGLLRAGQAGWQLTWMDARVGDREVTPRIGKAVEINALWLSALDALVGWAGTAEPRRAAWSDLLARGRLSFRARFWRPELGHLADVVDGPDGDDTTLRPNQLLALALPAALLEDDEARSVLDAVDAHLLNAIRTAHAGSG
jgi:predicted glycogen debranching enzyme